MALGLVTLSAGSRLGAQTATLWLDTGAGQSRWATDGTVSSRLTYGAVGLRGTWHPPGPLGGAARIGAGLGGDGEAGSAGWLSADGGLSLRRSAGAALARLSVEGWGLRYDQVSRYSAAGVRVAPLLDWRVGTWSVRGRGELSWGGWDLTTDAEPASEQTVTSGSLRLLGGSLELLHARGPFWFRTGPTAFRSRGRVPDRWQVAGEGEAGVVAGPMTLSAGARWLSAVAADSTARTASVGALARARLALGDRWGVSLYFDGRPWDPMHAVQRGTVVHAGLEWRAAPAGRSRLPVIELAQWAGTGRTVRFRLEAKAERVELLGDFSGWQPLPMVRRGAVWEAEIIVPAGTHQFGFLLDGATWMVPSHAPGIVTDGWQRRNATITILEPAP
jgi:hypothetical protein